MVKQITVLGGLDKDGAPENVRRLDINVGEIFAVVGPTGSGKTQLIADIEQYAEEERLTGRQILIDGRRLQQDRDKRAFRYLVAQVSQNMNFVIDMSIEDFLFMHARVRDIPDPGSTVKEVLDISNQLSGEAISFSTNLTQLSGGQSRALMVADVALISKAPIVLIDEIENAGINRLQALEILTGRGKIVFIVSHDPTLMLMAEQRITMKNGGMDKICLTTPEEKKLLVSLMEMEKSLDCLRDNFRSGKSIGTEEDPKGEWFSWPRF